MIMINYDRRQRELIIQMKKNEREKRVREEEERKAKLNVGRPSF